VPRSTTGNGRAPSRSTIRDIAKRSSVSIATVSRVLNGRPDVSDETRDTVLRLIREHGYASNRTARTRGKVRTVLYATSPIRKTKNLRIAAQSSTERTCSRQQHTIGLPFTRANAPCGSSVS